MKNNQPDDIRAAYYDLFGQGFTLLTFLERLAIETVGPVRARELLLQFEPDVSPDPRLDREDALNFTAGAIRTHDFLLRGFEREIRRTQD